MYNGWLSGDVVGMWVTQSEITLHAHTHTHALKWEDWGYIEVNLHSYLWIDLASSPGSLLKRGRGERLGTGLGLIQPQTNSFCFKFCLTAVEKFISTSCKTKLDQKKLGFGTSIDHDDWYSYLSSVIYNRLWEAYQETRFGLTLLHPQLLATIHYWIHSLSICPPFLL